MFKKITAMLLMVMVLFTVMATMTVSAEGDNYVKIQCFAAQSDAKGEDLEVYFKNTATGEEITIYIRGGETKDFTDIAVGEYEFVKCNIYNNPNVVFELASSQRMFEVKENENSYYTFRLANTYTELQEGALEEYKEQEQLEILYVVACLAIIALFIVWLVFAIMGRKNYRKKMIARLLLHLMLSSIGFLVALAATSADPENFMIWLVGAGFPYGIFLTSYFGYKRDESRGYYVVRENESAGSFVARWALILAFSALLGIIALPIVLIIDIVKICKAGKEDMKYA